MSMVENNIKSAIILEDDAIVHSTLRKLLKIRSIKLIKSWVDLFDHGKLNPIFKKRIVEGYRLALQGTFKNSRRCIIYATAYLITLSGAKNYLTTLIQ